jgi:hypothetical protein
MIEPVGIKQPQTLRPILNFYPNPPLHRKAMLVVIMIDPSHIFRLCDKLDDTTSLLDLLLRESRDVACAHDDGDVGQAALSEHFRVAEGEEVEHGCLVGLLVQVLVALLGGDERPQLVEVDDGLPELVLELVEVPHTDFTEVTGMIFVDIRSVVML